MQSYHFNYTFTHIPPVLKRNQHALIAVEDSTHHIVLGGKNIYPPDIYRLVGGGIDVHEDPQLGATRELQEELGITVKSDELKLLAEINLDLKETSTQKNYYFKTFIYYLKTDQTLTPADDLDNIKHFTRAELKDLVDLYYDLPDTLITVAKDGDDPFRWSDYGQVYGKIHEILLAHLHAS